MTQDARFEDGGDRPLRLIAADAEDLQVISSLVQDAVFPVGEMKYIAKQRRFALLLNRFRWEDATRKRQRNRAYERAQVSIDWQPGADGAGRLELILAGDGAIALEVECINATLQDVTQAYVAPSGKMPQHPD